MTTQCHQTLYMQIALQRTTNISEPKAGKIPFEETVRRLNDKIRHLEELHCIMAHDLRGPVLNIQQLTDILKILSANEADGQPCHIKDCITLIESAGTQLLSSLDTLLESAKIGLNNSISYDDCDIAEIIAHVFSQLNNDNPNKQACIEQNLFVKQVSAPKTYLTSILYNLLSNALKYSSHDQPTEITITTQLKVGAVVLTVKDNGSGIDLERYRDKIFNLNQYFHEGYDSKGVGLYLTRTQVESMGGRITVESAPGKGSTFTIYFPRVTTPL